MRIMTKTSKSPPTAPVEEALPDDLAEQITNAMRGMHTLREENASLREQLTACEQARNVLDSRLADLRAQLDNERAERRHYHSLANEIITRLDIVGRTVDDVVRRAQTEAARQDAQPDRALPQFQIPEFLRKGPAEEPEKIEEAADAA